MIDHPEALFGIQGVVGKLLGDVDLQVAPCGYKASFLDRVHGRVADIVVEITDDDHPLRRLFRQYLACKRVGMARVLIFFRTTDMKRVKGK